MAISGRASKKVGFGALQMFHWCTYGSFTTFFVAFATDVRGIEDGVVFILIACFMLSALAGQFFINAICDKYQNNRKMFMVMSAAVLALYYALYFSNSLATLTLFYLLLGFIQPSIAAVLDTWIIRSYPDEPNAYAPIRSVASITFAILVLAAGSLISTYGYSVSLISGTVFAIGGISMAYFMPEIPSYQRGREITKKFTLKSIPPSLYIMLGAMLFSGMGVAPVLQAAKYITNDNVKYMSWATFANAACEFPMMQLSRKLTHVPASVKLLIAAGMYTVSTSIMIFAGSLPLMILMYGVNGLAYGLLLPARRQLVAETAPEGTHNRMHGIGDAVYGNVGGFLGNTSSGHAYERGGVGAMLGLCAAYQAVSMALYAVLHKRSTQKTGVSQTSD